MIPAGRTDNCIMCFSPLTPWERHYYEYRCEKCEGAFSERLYRWRRGGEDAELDAHFGDDGR